MNLKEYAKRSRELSEAGADGPWRSCEPTQSDGTSRLFPHIHMGPGECGTYDGQVTINTSSPPAGMETIDANAALIAHNRTAADVWREAFLKLEIDLESTDLWGVRRLAEEAFARAHEKVTGITGRKTNNP